MSRPTLSRCHSALLVALSCLALLSTTSASEPAAEKLESGKPTAIPPTPTRLRFALDEAPLLSEALVTAARPAELVLSPPPGRLFEIRVFAEGDAAAIVVFRGAALEPEPGAAPADRTQMWMSSCERAEELRILVVTTKAEEIRAQLGVRLYPPETDSD